MVFNTKFKAFFVFRRFSEIIIKESFRGRTFSVGASIADGRWLEELIVEILNKKIEKVWRTVRTGEGRLMAEVCRNRAGEFLKITKLERGRLRMVVIPGENGCEGWRLFSRDLQRALHGDREAGWPRDRGFQNKGGQFVVNKEPEQEERREWRLAIGIWRSGISVTWSEVRTCLEKKLGRKCRVHTLGVDRAIFWSRNIEEKSKILETQVKLQREVHGDWVRMEEWKPDFHWKNLKIKAQRSWIGIEGIPLNMWNIHVFKVLGGLCGGLEEIAKETLDKNFLKYAKVKVAGNRSGFLNSVKEILCEGEKIQLGLRALNRRSIKEVGYRMNDNSKRVSREEEEIRPLFADESEGNGSEECRQRSHQRRELMAEEVEEKRASSSGTGKKRADSPRHLASNNRFAVLETQRGGNEELGDFEFQRTGKFFLQVAAREICEDTWKSKKIKRVTWKWTQEATQAAGKAGPP